MISSPAAVYCVHLLVIPRIVSREFEHLKRILFFEGGRTTDSRLCSLCITVGTVHQRFSTVVTAARSFTTNGDCTDIISVFQLAPFRSAPVRQDLESLC